MNKVDVESSIPAFYAGKSVFITGGTGFMGKILVEKLLWSCPDIREIFLLMRPKKGVNINDRIKNMITLPIFDRLRKKKPQVFGKLIVVSGDSMKEGLGIGDLERRFLIERVSIFFHAAASVRFDDSLKTAVMMNTRSTRDACILAAQMKKLEVFMHVSTAYTQADKPIVEEKHYPSEVDWKKTIKIAETVDEEILKTLTPKYLGNFPNTYTFTKRLAEQIVNDYSHVIPAIIFRPSIVISTLTEPMPGWVDNFNGPVGIMIGGGKGVLKVVLSDPEISADFIPVDVAIKAMITASWKRGLKKFTADPAVHVYNCSSADIKSVSLEEVANLGLRCQETYPLEGIIWKPDVLHVRSRFTFFIYVLILHILPSLILDGILKISGKKTMLVKLQRKVYIANSALSHFTTNSWHFKNDKLLNLLSDVPPSDIETFGYEYATFDINQYFTNCLIGAKVYLLNESMDNLPVAKAHLQRNGNPSKMTFSRMKKIKI
ncbi:hypothetical protein HCN44_001037 [Aphidius gifuensis]|uniref:Fatty acyl-CoA reductase n=1 Tax=Aphidius gifuensis TaxID=684658 RepID=A0A834XNH2_APHGI|nr:hypothetical protein HCN44_001037 [Aphidius gifuensis]